MLGISPGEECYVDLKAWGHGYFIKLQLPVVDKVYVVRCYYRRWNDRKHRGIVMASEIFAEEFVWSAFSVYAYGMDKSLNLDTMVLVDDEFCDRYPLICA